MKQIIVWSTMDFTGAGLQSAIAVSGLEPVFVCSMAALQFALRVYPTAPLFINLLGNDYTPTEKILWLNNHVDGFAEKQVALLLRRQHETLVPELLLLENCLIVTDNVRLVQLHETLLQLVVNQYRPYGDAPTAERGRLTQMEKSILRLLLQDADIRRASQQLEINYKTAQGHKMRAIRKLGFRNSAQLYKNLNGFRALAS
ncbi:LuxR C-terminal-related transcriptional regulator [Trabulsiella odontotermitis]|uniref:helix-turn-helix transcriptional regulator n=1 Tax=Trabulsiella odontotermitis TaxID=379893 RepID=UPI0024B85121|nr:LuxR C-terminal-related transcriptional regulator [Trabulsiella odontotermitis]WHP32319.1 LuxR C-terminal-related transcriptional regulator [Trabulsiella odontotermitis]